MSTRSSGTSPKQAAARALQGHISVLDRLDRGLSPWASDVASPNETRGRRTVIATLARWGALQRGDEGLALTDHGRAILAECKARAR